MLRRVGIETEQVHTRTGGRVRLTNGGYASRAETISPSEKASRASQSRGAAEQQAAGDACDAVSDEDQVLARETQVGSASVTKPNGADPDQVANEVQAGHRCGYCGCEPVAPVKHNGRVYCADACLQEVRGREARDRAADAPPAAPAPPPPKRSRIRRRTTGATCSARSAKQWRCHITVSVRFTAATGASLGSLTKMPISRSASGGGVM
jgi:hypothetical protein